MVKFVMVPEYDIVYLKENIFRECFRVLKSQP